MTKALERSKLDVSTVQGCVEGVLKVQSREEKSKEDDRDRRRNNIIIHGLREPTATTAVDRRNEDIDVAHELLHNLACDDVSISHITRLSPPPSSSEDKPRPIKLDLTPQEARNNVLRNARNLKLKSLPGSPWGRVFIHQDLTPREREVRRMVVQELNTRRQAAEANLTIVNGKIVTKRTYEY